MGAKTSAASVYGKLSSFRMMGYGLGDAANNFVWGMTSVYLMFFYTDVYGISPAAVASLFLVARFLDAIFDPIIGMIVDKTNSRWGRFRPYLLFGSIPLSVMFVLCFSTPDMGNTGKLVYAYVTYILLGFLYSLVNIPYSAMSPVITQDQRDRTKLMTYRMIFANVATLIVSYATSPLASWFGGDNTAKGYQYTVGLYAIVAIVLLLGCFKSTQERIPIQKEVSTKGGLKTLAKNRPLLLSSFAMMLSGGANTIFFAIPAYYFKYNVGREDLAAYYIPVVLLMGMIGMACVPFVEKRIGKKNTLQLAFLITIVGSVCLYFTSYSSITLIFIFPALIGLTLTVPWVVGWTMAADSVDYGEWKTGVRAEGISYASFSFAQKVATALAGSLSGILLTLTGYVANQAQTITALHGIAFSLTLAPAILTLGAMVLIFFYNLTDRKYAEIIQELEQRKAQQA